MKRSYNLYGVWDYCRRHGVEVVVVDDDDGFARQQVYLGVHDAWRQGPKCFLHGFHNEILGSCNMSYISYGYNLSSLGYHNLGS